MLVSEGGKSDMGRFNGAGFETFEVAHHLQSCLDSSLSDIRNACLEFVVSWILKISLDARRYASKVSMGRDR